VSKKKSTLKIFRSITVMHFRRRKKCFLRQAQVAHACNPSCSGGRDQEDHSSKPPGQIVLETLSRKTLSQKAGIGPEFKPQYHTKKKKFFPMETSRSDSSGGCQEL
jgi:hypothetical protein